MKSSSKKVNSPERKQNKQGCRDAMDNDSTGQLPDQLDS